MNSQSQNSKSAIQWTRIGGRPGFTWNPIVGCQHKCEWFVGAEHITCYAKRIVESSRMKKFYGDGFEHHYFMEKRLQEPFSEKEPAGIFISSIGDIFGAPVEDHQIERVMQVCEQTPQHIYFLLTKNPARLRSFYAKHGIPGNVWCGISTPPDRFNGNDMPVERKHIWLQNAMRALQSIARNGNITFLSAEPLSWDVGAAMDGFESSIRWCIIGGASVNARRIVPPVEEYRTRLERVLDRAGVAVFHKHNLAAFLPEEEVRREWPAFAAGTGG